jgi:hypothetical protein
VSKTGRYEWHDHRMHYRGTGLPAKVKDPSVRQTVSDWNVPMAVDPARLDQRTAAVDAARAGCIVVIVVRWRRAAATEPKEAW